MSDPALAKAIDGLDAGRRAGWAKFYAAEERIVELDAELAVAKATIHARDHRIAQAEATIMKYGSELQEIQTGKVLTGLTRFLWKLEWGESEFGGDFIYVSGPPIHDQWNFSRTTLRFDSFRGWHVTETGEG